MKEISNLHHFLFLHPSRRHRRSADANTARLGDGFGVKRDRVFVDRDRRMVEGRLSFHASETSRTQIHKHQVIVSAAGNDSVAEHREAGCERLGVVDDLPGVIFERGLERLVQANGFRRDHMH